MEGIDFEAMAEAWEKDRARDRGMSNEALAQEVADIAADGRPIYATLLGLLRRIRPTTDLEETTRRIARMIVGPHTASADDPSDLEDLQSARWDSATEAEQSAATETARAIVEDVIRPVVERGPKVPDKKEDTNAPT